MKREQSGYQKLKKENAELKADIITLLTKGIDEQNAVREKYIPAPSCQEEQPQAEQPAEQTPENHQEA